jgi:hypothetical protein
MTALTIHQPIGNVGVISALAGRVTAWRQRRTEARMVREVKAANTGRITMAEFLQRLGADETAIRAVEVKVGKAVAQAYRAATDGAEPEKTGLALVRGRIVHVNAYGWDRLDLISSVAVNIPAVAALIGA